MPTLFKKIDLSHARRVYVVGDIHGSFSKLQDALNQRAFMPEKGDHLLSVGDLVDRGPENEKVLEWLEYPWFHAIQGNHETMHYDPKYASALHHPANGGGWAWKLDDPTYKKIQEAFQNLPVLMEVLVPSGKRIGLAHANYPSVDWKFAEDMIKYNQKHIIWDRSYLYDKLYDIEKGETPDVVDIIGIDDIYYGHTPMKKPLHLGNQHWIDTGGTFEDGLFTIIDVT